jgi:SAM-dependent methyltransferase
MIRRKLFENFAHPRGLWGRLAGQVMARKPANVERGKWALAELDPGPDDRVLELGYGPGLSLAEACRRVDRGRVIGVDQSSVMLRQARRRNAGALRDGRLELRVGDAQRLDADLCGLDLIYGINVWQFWTDQAATVHDLAGRLGPAGRLALLYMQHRERQQPATKRASGSRSSSPTLASRPWRPARCGSTRRPSW